jgi:hypothetical protein
MGRPANVLLLIDDSYSRSVKLICKYDESEIIVAIYGEMWFSFHVAVLAGPWSLAGGLPFQAEVEV